MITFRGVFLVATAIFTFFLARLTQVGWLYVLDAVLWGVILLSVVMPWLAVMSLRAGLRLRQAETNPGPPGPAEGDAINLELILENLKPWPRFLLSASFNCPLAGPGQRLQRFFVPKLAARSSLPLVNEVECYKRGLHQFHEVVIESKAPFGLFRRRRRLTSHLSVLVYPQVVPLSRLQLLEGTEGTTTQPRKVRMGLEVSGSRRYVAGDSIRSIHWKNTVRLGRPMVKEFEDTQDNALAIAFSSSRVLGEERETTLEYSIKLAASVAAYVVEHGGTVQVVTGGLPGREMAWTMLLKELALVEADPRHTLPDIIESLSPGSRVLAIVSEEDVDGIEALKQMSGRMSGLAVLVLEGFEQGPAGRTNGTLDSLHRAGLSVESCERGKLADALKAMESMQWTKTPEYAAK